MNLRVIRNIFLYFLMMYFACMHSSFASGLNLSKSKDVKKRLIKLAAENNLSQQQRIDRLSNLRKAVKTFSKKERLRSEIEILLFEARLESIVLASRARKRLLQKALIKSKAVKNNRQIKDIQMMLIGDRDLINLSRYKSKRAVAKNQKKLRNANRNVSETLKIYKKWKHTEQEMRSKIAVFYFQFLRSKSEKIDERAWQNLEREIRNKSLKNRNLKPLLKMFYLSRLKFEKQEKNFEMALKYSLRADDLDIQSPRLEIPKKYKRSPKKRFYAMSSGSEELCHKVLDKNDRGMQCSDLVQKNLKIRDVEKSLFFDYSKMSTLSEFSFEWSSKTTSMYKSLLLRCISTAAQSEEVLNERVRLEWSIKNNGYVGLVEIHPNWIEKTKLKKCLNTMLHRFRYRPYRGEVQSVLLEFDIGE